MECKATAVQRLAHRDQHGIERSKMSLCVPVHPQGKRFREKEKSVWSEGNKGREISGGSISRAEKPLLT